jgi:hypothetical protein
LTLSSNALASHPTFFLRAFDLLVSFTCPEQQVHVHATPLLEEKWDLGSQALISNICDHSCRIGLAPGPDSPIVIYWGLRISEAVQEGIISSQE